MNFKILFVLFFTIFTSKAFIINNKSGKTLAVFFHKKDQVLPSKYYEYLQGSIKEGRENPVKNFEEPECFLIEPGKSEINFKEGLGAFVIVDHYLAMQYKIKINGSWGNIYYDLKSKTHKVKSASIEKADQEKLKWNTTILEITMDKGTGEFMPGEYSEFLKIIFKDVNDDSAFTAFLHQATNLCAIL